MSLPPPTGRISPLIPIGIDALNVAHWCGATPQLRLPLALLLQLHRRGHAAHLYCDASARHRFAADGALYAQLLAQARYTQEVAAGRSADGALLRDARASGGCIISRDHYRDHRRRYRKLIDEPGRLLTGFVRDEVLHLPALALQVVLPATADEAWQQLLALEARDSTAECRSAGA